MAGQAIPAVVAGLCDDAAVFPPGLAPLPDAVRAHLDRASTWYAALTGPFILAASALEALGPLLPDGARLAPSVTLPQGPEALPDVLAAAEQLPVDLRSVEVVVPADVTADAFFAQLDGLTGIDVYVEVPRDERRGAILDRLPGRYRAKFRTGGVRADLYPDEAELADALAAVVTTSVPFKATAGLHHAVRNTDPETGFEQHGFLNLVLATDALLTTQSTVDARALLAERDPKTVAKLVTGMAPERVAAARAAFTSFGTCSITDPLHELMELGIVTGPQMG